MTEGALKGTATRHGMPSTILRMPKFVGNPNFAGFPQDCTLSDRGCTGGCRFASRHALYNLLHAKPCSSPDSACFLQDCTLDNRGCTAGRHYTSWYALYNPLHAKKRSNPNSA